MAKLIVFGNDQDWNEELEIRVTGGFGLVCYIIFKDGESETKIVGFHNCTEFHHKFGSLGGRPSTAFESDIHSTGCTFDINRLEGITVEWATKKFDKF